MAERGTAPSPVSGAREQAADSEYSSAATDQSGRGHDASRDKRRRRRRRRKPPPPASAAREQTAGETSTATAPGSVIVCERLPQFYRRDLFRLGKEDGWWHSIDPPHDIDYEEPGDYFVKMYRPMKHLYPNSGVAQLLVQLSGFDAFASAMVDYRANHDHGAFLLPFGCACEGGELEHRHLLLAAREMTEWRREIDESMERGLGPAAEDGIPYTRCLVIGEEEELNFVIEILSGCQFQCDFLHFGDEDSDDEYAF